MPNTHGDVHIRSSGGVLSKLILLLGLLVGDVAVAEMLWIEERTQKGSVEVNATTFAEIRKHLDIPVRIEKVSAVRAFRLLEDKQILACRGNLLKTKERELKYAMTTVPQVVFPGLMLHSHQSLGDQSSIGIENLAQLRKSLFLDVGREYGFDKRVLSNNSLSVLPGYSHNSAKTAIEMFNKGRFDLLIEYPNVYQAISKNSRPVGVYVYRIEELAPYSLGYIACTRNEQGKKLVSKLDEILTTLSQTPSYFDAQIRWANTDAHVRIYNEIYGTDFKPRLMTLKRGIN